MGGDKASRRRTTKKSPTILRYLRAAGPARDGGNPVPRASQVSPGRTEIAIMTSRAPLREQQARTQVSQQAVMVRKQTKTKTTEKELLVIYAHRLQDIDNLAIAGITAVSKYIQFEDNLGFFRFGIILLSLVF